MTEVAVENILIERFKTLDNLTTDKETDLNGNEVITYPEVSFPNEPFERPDDGYWYELRPTPAKSVDAYLGSEEQVRWIGVLQINICVPKNSGLKPLNSRYEAIAKLYKRGLVINGIRIISSDRTSAIDDGDYYVMPIQIVWESNLER